MGQSRNDKPEASCSRSKGFHPLIIRQANGFCVYLPEWRISGTGPSLEDAYRDFEEKMAATERNTAEFGLLALTPEPYPTIKKRAILQELALFWIKVGSTALIAILSVVLLLPNISAALRHNLKEIIPKEIFSPELKDPRYWAIQFPAQMNARLDRLKPEEEEQMRNEWNRFLGRTVPIFTPLGCPSETKAKAKPGRP
jgi:hypothetical protein